MKPEDQAWRALQDHAAAQLRDGFADRVLRRAHGPQAETWSQFQAEAAAQLRPGFAERVLRAARQFTGNVPSLFDQFALGAATVAVCLITVFFVHTRSNRSEEERVLARWQEYAAEAHELNADR